MKRLSHRALPLAMASALAVLAAGGCGREEQPDLVNGKTLFAQKCAACHVLTRANAQGVQGPNLDEAFEPAIRDGMNRKTVEGVVLRQIANVRRSSSMPANLVVGDDARDVSAYVSQVAGKGGQDQGELAQAGKPKTSNKPVVAENGTLKIDADPSGALAFTASKAEAKPGSIELVMDNPASIEHNIAVKGDKKGAVVGKGGTSNVSVTLKAGEYEYYCSVPGHAAAGMVGTLFVE